MEIQYIVGVDGSFTNMGISIMNLETKQLSLKTGTFLKMMDYLQEKEIIMAKAGIILEDPNLTTRFWGAGAIEAAAINFKKGQIQYPEFQSMLRIAFMSCQDVGKNKAAADLFCELMIDYPVLKVDPSKRQRADNDKHQKTDIRLLIMPTKTSMAQFYKLTGSEQRCSEHARDAATLIWGKTAANFRSLYAIQKAEVDRIEAERKRKRKDNDDARKSGKLNDVQDEEDETTRTRDMISQLENSGR